MKNIVFLLLFVVGTALGGNSFHLGVYPRGGSPEYNTVNRESRYLTMRDGVKIAVDVYLPGEMNDSTRLPTLVVQTRYWRAGMPNEGQEVAAPQNASFFVERGYAVLMVDVRGTGASFGTRPYPYADKEVSDGSEIVDWIIAQPWSNGNVGAFGTSYLGNTAALLAVHNHPAVKVVIPRFYDFDVYTDLIWPGGVRNEMMLREWGQAVRAMDENKGSNGVSPVDGPDGKLLLKQAVSQHKDNLDVDLEGQKVDFRDQAMKGGGSGVTIGLYSHMAQIRKSRTFSYLWGSWMDAGTARGVLHQLAASHKDRVRAVIGPWNHGGHAHASPYLPLDTQTSPGVSDQWTEMLKCFDTLLRGRKTEFDQQPLLTYYTMGEERWHDTDQWPLPDMKQQTWYLGQQQSLTDKAPEAAGEDRYKVQYSASSGSSNRWHTQLGGGDVFYPDRKKAAKKALTYTSPVLEGSLEVTGFPEIHLNLASSREDGVLFVYLEDVAPDGTVTYVTEGLLRLSHRKLSAEKQVYSHYGPYRTHNRADARPMVPDKQEAVSFALLPTSMVFAKGHRIRIAITGADKDTFSRYSARGKSTYTFAYGGAEPAHLILPSKPRPDLDHRPSSLDAFAGTYKQENGRSVTVGNLGGLLRLTANDPETLSRMRPENRYPQPEKLEKQFENLLVAIGEGDWKVVEGMCNPVILPQLKQAAAGLDMSKVQIKGMWLNRGLARIAFELPTPDGVIQPLFLFRPGNLELFWFYGDQPLPQIRLSAAGPDRFLQLDSGNLAVTFQRDDRNKIVALRFGGEEYRVTR